MTARVHLADGSARANRLEKALFRGGGLSLDNADYRRAAEQLLGILLRGDMGRRDLTVDALGIKGRAAEAVFLAGESGVAAGLEEAALLLRGQGIETRLVSKDGEAIGPGDVLLDAEGDEGKLLSFERVVLNLLQRMSGIASAARSLQERVARVSQATHVVGTRKTLWGLLDKRALHLGNGGTHRLNLSDAILIKNNHLALLGTQEEDAVGPALERAWAHRVESAFVEVEVRGERAALEAAKTFRRLQEKEAGAAAEYPCLLMLDNMPPTEISGVLDTLRRDGLWDSVLVEASGGITDANLESYAATGVDAISMGALTHSARALDVFARIS